MVHLRITQRSISINKEQLLLDAQKILTLLNYADYDLGIWVTNNKTIRWYNTVYRGKKAPTDILSFPYHTTLIAGHRIKPRNAEDRNLGDLILSAEYVVEEAKKYNVTFEQRLQRLLVHGICHLLGYDHIKDEDYRRMRAKEGYLLKKLAEK
jgi:rRNA maturation RNase YbeY